MPDDPADPTEYTRTEYYYTFGWQVFEERQNTFASLTGSEGARENPATTVKVQYVWDQRYIDALVCRDRDADADGDCTEAGDEHLYYCQDANYNVTALVNTSGTVVERYVYDPYGKPAVLDADWSADADGASDYANEVLYAGYRFDSESGLYQVRHRAYHPTLGRWMQRDPIGYADGVGLYEYARNGPVAGVDPFGLWTPRRHRQITAEAMQGHPAYLGRLHPDYVAAFIRGNVGTDDASMAGTANWFVKGFDAAEAEKHYMVGSDQEGQNGADRRQKAKDRAEGRISRMRDNAGELFERGKELKAGGKREQGHRACIFAWETLGTSCHTLQDKFAHTDEDYDPLTSAEHGGTMSTSDPGFWSKVGGFLSPVYRMGKFLTKDVWNDERKRAATSLTQGNLVFDFAMADGPKRCNCIEK